jgi:aspartyl-tRNA(Asn)/glutamyl-tRNA(Gln) amidotransferase subunit A
MDIVYTPFNVTAGPALALCTGYTEDGLPIGMQIVGAPFADDVVLRVGYAYEQATQWRARRPPEPKEKTPLPPPPNTRLQMPPPLSISERGHVATLALRSGFRLTPQQLERLERAAAHTLARSARVPRDQPQEVQLASVFRFPAA